MNGGEKLRAEIIPASEGMKTTSDCNYRVTYNNDTGKLKWLLREGDTQVCAVGSDMTVDCDKSYNKDKNRYNTNLHVRDAK